MSNCLANHKITQIFTRRQYYGSCLTSIVASTYPVDKKDFRFFPQILNSKFQILNNIESQNPNDKNSEAFFDNAPINLEEFVLNFVSREIAWFFYPCHTNTDEVKKLPPS